MATTAGSRRNSGAALIFLLGAAVFLNYVDRGAIAVAAPLMKGELSLSATTFGIPQPPSNVRVAVVSPTGLRVVWDDNSQMETGFKIERSPNGSTNWTQIGTTSAGVTTYHDMGLAPLTTYYYRVRAYNGTSNSPYSNAVGTTTP